MRYPDLIKKNHIKMAAKYLRQHNTFLNFGKSIAYDVFIDGQPYPPKAICSIAHQMATGRALSVAEFSGAKNGPWHRMLKTLNFEVVEKGGADWLYLMSIKIGKKSQKSRLNQIACEANKIPEEIKVTVTRFKRSANVMRECLYRADGKCWDCNQPAPFKRQKDGTPYLEVHHIQPLSYGGFDSVENTVALCPNCHSKRHDQMGLDKQAE